MEYRLWRACERFGIDPRAIDAAAPAWVSRLLAFEEIREEEELRESIARAGGQV